MDSNSTPDAENYLSDQILGSSSADDSNNFKISPYSQSSPGGEIVITDENYAHLEAQVIAKCVEIFRGVSDEELARKLNECTIPTQQGHMVSNLFAPLIDQDYYNYDVDAIFADLTRQKKQNASMAIAKRQKYLQEVQNNVIRLTGDERKFGPLKQFNIVNQRNPMNQSFLASFRRVAQVNQSHTVNQTCSPSQLSPLHRTSHGNQHGTVNQASLLYTSGQVNQRATVSLPSLISQFPPFPEKNSVHQPDRVNQSYVIRQSSLFHTRSQGNQSGTVNQSCFMSQPSLIHTTGQVNQLATVGQSSLTSRSSPFYTTGEMNQLGTVNQSYSMSMPSSFYAGQLNQCSKFPNFSQGGRVIQPSTVHQSCSIRQSSSFQKTVVQVNHPGTVNQFYSRDQSSSVNQLGLPNQTRLVNQSGFSNQHVTYNQFGLYNPSTPGVREMYRRPELPAAHTQNGSSRMMHNTTVKKLRKNEENPELGGIPRETLRNVLAPYTVGPPC